MKIWAKTTEFFEGKFLVVRRDGSVPHWPHFVLGARDPNAPAALLAYANACGSAGLDPAYCNSLRELADDFRDYRMKHGEGDADAAPHRKDDPAVISAMRGFNSNIFVMPDTQNHPKTQEAKAMIPNAGETPKYDHVLKSWPQFFQPIVTGAKKHDLRRQEAGRIFKVGDIILLQEYDPVRGRYTGNEFTVRVTFITSNDTPCACSSAALERGYAILSIERAMGTLERKAS